MTSWRRLVSGDWSRPIPRIIQTHPAHHITGTPHCPVLIFKPLPVGYGLRWREEENVEGDNDDGEEGFSYAYEDELERQEGDQAPLETPPKAPPETQPEAPPETPPEAPPETPLEAPPETPPEALPETPPEILPETPP